MIIQTIIRQCQSSGINFTTKIEVHKMSVSVTLKRIHLFFERTIL